MHITSEHIEELNNTVDMGPDTFEFRAYSGRGMFGAECLAVVTEASKWAVLTALIEHRNFLGDDADLEMYSFIHVLIEQEPNQDSMGFSNVYYWPTVKVSDADD